MDMTTGGQRGIRCRNAGTFSTGAVLLAGALLAVSAPTARAAAILPGFDANTVPRNDDGSTGLVDIGFSVNFFGETYSQLYVNNNGNVTFDAALATFTPFSLTSTNRVIIAPFFADVDTRSAGNPVTYGEGTVDGRSAFGVNWVDVDYFVSDGNNTNRNSFQLLLIERADTGAGNFDFWFNYDQIQWEAGQASGSDPEGLGGSSARAGFSNGTGAPGTAFELMGSAINGAFLDDELDTGLIYNSRGTTLDGRYIFEVRNGRVEPPNGTVPEPTALALMGIALLPLARRLRRR